MGRRFKRTAEELDAVSKKRDPAVHEALFAAYWQKSTPRSRSSSSGSASTLTSQITSSSSIGTSVEDTPDAPVVFKPSSESSVSSERNKDLNTEMQPEVSHPACAIDKAEPNNNKNTAGSLMGVKNDMVTKPSLSKEECEAIKRNLRKGTRSKKSTSNNAPPRVTPKAKNTAIVEASPRCINNATQRVAPKASPKVTPKTSPVPSPHLRLRSAAMLSEAEARNWAEHRPGFDPIKYLFGDKSEEEIDVISPLPEYTRELEELEDLFQGLTCNIPAERGHKLSRAERESKGYIGCTDVGYGEVTFEMVARCIQVIKQEHGGLATGGEIFYDLGSGTGKAVIAASMCHRFKVAKGIEIMHSLHHEAKRLQSNWATVLRDKLPDRRGEVMLELLKGDLTQADWRDADFLFANSTVFSKALLATVEEKSRGMKVGSFFVTTTKKLPGQYWEVISAHKAPMSFGFAHVFIQRKVK